MRVIFVLLAIACVGIFMVGRGWLGTAPFELGRQPQRVGQDLNADNVKLARPEPPVRTGASNNAKPANR